MKTKLLILPLLIIGVSLFAQEPTRSGLTFIVDWSGTANEFDINAAHWLVDQENTRRAAADPPEAALPKATNAQLKSSAITILQNMWQNAWENYGRNAINVGYVNGAPEKTTDEVKELWKNSTDAGRAAALAALEAAQNP